MYNYQYIRLTDDELTFYNALKVNNSGVKILGDGILRDIARELFKSVRVRTVNHLAGGNPRIYVILSEFLTRDSLDELTPYYQARITALSTQQRKIVEFLCNHAAPATVKELAKRCFMSPQTASSQLKDLKEKGYVLPDPLGPTGRDTYYELKEPLMRLCLEVKKSHRTSIRLLIDFVRYWYSLTELEQRFCLCRQNSCEPGRKPGIEHPDSELSLCLTNVLLRYKETYNKRILLELPVEERKILEPLLNVTEKQALLF